MLPLLALLTSRTPTTSPDAEATVPHRPLHTLPLCDPFATHLCISPSCFLTPAMVLCMLWLLEQIRPAPTSGPLHSLFLLPRMLFPQIPTRLIVFAYHQSPPTRNISSQESKSSYCLNYSYACSLNTCLHRVGALEPFLCMERRMGCREAQPGPGLPQVAGRILLLKGGAPYLGSSQPGFPS